MVEHSPISDQQLAIAHRYKTIFHAAINRLAMEGKTVYVGEEAPESPLLQMTTLSLRDPRPSLPNELIIIEERVFKVDSEEIIEFDIRAEMTPQVTGGKEVIRLFNFSDIPSIVNMNDEELVRLGGRCPDILNDQYKANAILHNIQSWARV